MYTHKTYFSHKVLCSTKNKLLSLLLMTGIAPWFVSSGKLFFKEFCVPTVYIFQSQFLCGPLGGVAYSVNVLVCMCLRVIKSGQKSEKVVRHFSHYLDAHTHKKRSRRRRNQHQKVFVPKVIRSSLGPSFLQSEIKMSLFEP